MKVATKSVTICRKTGKVLKEEILEVFEMDEDEYYRPLVEVFGNAFLKEFNEGKV